VAAPTWSFRAGPIVMAVSEEGDVTVDSTRRRGEARVGWSELAVARASPVECQEPEAELEPADAPIWAAFPGAGVGQEPAVRP
jgi:hypothetical protein